MFQHLLVPLDGSSRAEEALPLAVHLAQQTRGTLTLLCAVPYTHTSTAAILAKTMHEVLTQEAKEYLEQIAHTDLLAKVALYTKVLSELPTQAILNCAHAEHIDLIVLCSHGYAGFKRWTLGSVAQDIALHSPAPVVVLREKSQQSPLSHPEIARPVHALVALDGSSLAEGALRPAAQLVALVSPASTQGELHLIQVIKPQEDAEEHTSLKEGNSKHVSSADAAMHYMNEIKEQLSQAFVAKQKVQITSSIVEEPDIPTALLRAAERGSTLSSNGYDLIALATHGRSGIKRWIFGSVAERILKEATLPLLIVRPHESATSCPPS